MTFDYSFKKFKNSRFVECCKDFYLTFILNNAIQGNSAGSTEAGEVNFNHNSYLRRERIYWERRQRNNSGLLDRFGDSLIDFFERLAD